jgi:hypothetical protein
VTLRRISIALLVSSLVAACSGGGLPNGSVVNFPGGGGPTQPPTKLVNVKVTVTVPARKDRQRVRPGYISINTESLVIQLSSVDGNPVSGVNPTTINTTPHARGCKEEAGQTVCTATASGSPGDDVFAVTTYSSLNANGSLLSVGTVQAMIHSGGGVAINNLTLSLEGVIASLTISLAPHGAKRGKPAQAAVSLAAFDATGAQIVGPSHFAAPIALAIEGDTDKSFALHAAGKSGSSLSIVKPTSDITLTYDGKVRASSVTVQASVNGPSSIGASANFTLHGKVPPPPIGTIYVLNFGADDGKGATVTEYDGKAKGNAAPERVLELSSKLYARTIAVDSKNNLYVGYLDSELGYNPGTGQPDTGNEIAIFAPGASGKASPSAVIASNKKTNSNLYPIFITFDPSGRLVTYGATNVDGNNGDSRGAVLTYAAGSTGPVAPEYGFGFTSPYLNYSSAGPTGLAIDASNNFYINGKLEAGFGDYAYGLFVNPAADIGNPNSSASRTIPWDSKTKLAEGLTTNVALNQSGEISIGNTLTQGTGSKTSCQARVNVFAAGATGGTTDDPPLRILTLGGIVTKAGDCEDNPLLQYFPTIQLYGTSLFVADAINDAVDAFGAGGNGVVQPSLHIAGSATQLDAPIALAITSISGQAKASSAHPLLTQPSSIQKE